MIAEFERVVSRTQRGDLRRRVEAGADPLAHPDRGVGQEPGHGGGHSAVTAAVTADAGEAERTARCLAVCLTGRVYAIGLEPGAGGAVLWTADVPGYPDRSVKTSAAVDAECAYVSWGAGCAAFELSSGATRWEVAFGRGSHRTYDGPLICGELLVFSLARWGLLALRRRDGSVAWECRFPTEYFCAAPAGAGDQLVVAGADGELARVDGRRGTMVWQRAPQATEQGAGYAAGLTVDAGRFAATSAGTVECSALDTGRLEWRVDLAGADLLDMVPYRRGQRSLFAAPVPWDESLLVGAADGTLAVLDAGTGACLARTAFGAPITAPPAIAGGAFYVATYDGRLTCFGLPAPAAGRRRTRPKGRRCGGHGPS